MGQITWSPLALEDLNSIFEYISFDSTAYASKQIDRIIKRTRMLANLPLSGRLVPEYNQPNLRELIEGSYRIIYRLEANNNISIVRIHHVARLLTDI